MREVAADGAGLGPHRYGLEPHARERAQIGDEHLVVGDACGRLVEIEGIGVLHQELASAHHAEARALLVPELPLDVIENLGKLAIRADIGPEDFRDHVLVGWPVEQFAFVPVLDAQHLGAVGIVAPAFAPEIGKLQRRHQELDCASAILLLTHDLLDLLEHAKAERQPGIDAGRLLAHHAGAQHEAMGDDLCLFGHFTEDRQEVTG